MVTTAVIQALLLLLLLLLMMMQRRWRYMTTTETGRPLYKYTDDVTCLHPANTFYRKDNFAVGVLSLINARSAAAAPEFVSCILTISSDVTTV